MTTAYTSLLGLALPVTGELSGTWGDTVNNYITSYVDAAVAGAQTISGSQTAVTLSTTNGGSLTSAGSGSTGSAQYAIINCTGNPGGLLTITAPTTSKVYLILNNTSTAQSVKIVGTGPTTGVTVATAQNALVAWNGTDFELVATIDASKLTGILSVANGGTGAATLTANNVILGNGTSAVQFVAPGTNGNVLTSNGTTWTSAAPVATGDVTGPSSSVDNEIALFSSTTGKVIKRATTTGVLKASSGVIAAAVAGTDIVVPGGALGTPSSGTLSSCSGLPISTGVSGLGAGVATFLATPSSANLRTAVTDETGTGVLVFGTTPTITGGREVQVAVAASNIDLSLGNWFTRTISTTTTLTVSNVPTTGTAASFVLDLTNGGSATVNWWSGVKWAAGVAPTLTVSGRDSLGFYTYDGGTTWTGLVLAKDVK